jgi:hypothetical protein
MRLTPLRWHLFYMLVQRKALRKSFKSRTTISFISRSDFSRYKFLYVARLGIRGPKLSMSWAKSTFLLELLAEPRSNGLSKLDLPHLSVNGNRLYEPQT